MTPMVAISLERPRTTPAALIRFDSRFRQTQIVVVAVVSPVCRIAGITTALLL